ncbi:hypothetical protein F4604DRAFT_1890762 [Suillus subluteus]|nr:hypothetical protein F4604DRAFT_1890762 [Suillus subluteus]
MGGAGSESLRGRFRIFTQYGRLGAHAHGETLRYTCRQTLKTPVPISCLAKGSSDHFYAGSDDRSVHVYNQETLKVVKSIRGLREVSSIVYMSQCAQCRWPRGHALRFTMDTEKMILAKAHATLTQLAFCLDSGSVGVIDLSTKQVTRMKTSHDDLISDRPSELVSGGYDSRLLHHDIHQRTIVASLGVSMSPPCVLSSAMSPTGILAAGTADGWVWIGTGGEKMSGVSSGTSIQKKRRKCKGLEQDEAFRTDVGHDANRTFIGPRTLFTSTLIGKVTLHVIGGPTADGIFPKWTKTTADVNKVNRCRRL